MAAKSTKSTKEDRREMNHRGRRGHREETNTENNSREFEWMNPTDPIGLLDSVIPSKTSPLSLLVGAGFLSVLSAPLWLISLLLSVLCFLSSFVHCVLFCGHSLFYSPTRRTIGGKRAVLRGNVSSHQPGVHLFERHRHLLDVGQVGAPGAERRWLSGRGLGAAPARTGRSRSFPEPCRGRSDRGARR